MKLALISLFVAKVCNCGITSAIFVSWRVTTDTVHSSPSDRPTPTAVTFSINFCHVSHTVKNQGLMQWLRYSQGIVQAHLWVWMWFCWLGSRLYQYGYWRLRLWREATYLICLPADTDSCTSVSDPQNIQSLLTLPS
jgi:hypothetical protein